MRTAATITTLLATVALLALLLAGSRGHRLPTALLRPGSWMTALVVTGVLGGATTIGAMLADAKAFAATAIAATALLLVVELALLSDAFTFGSRDR
ncbi:MAG TPA: hypothetical protein VFG42_05740 [Baekduia sp.]|uniref:hypothetical protein n=1 Tax=Baekduia sp. TaxID=2600305 RepID=UPI002D76CC39|nr:hypothetical protein [Baekduia sp.]HET6506269.1 hypothetical protein [Baekduia sp.]